MTIQSPSVMLFRKWDFEGVEVLNTGLKNVISLKPTVIPTSLGRHEHQKFAKAQVNIVERLVNNLMHFGHRHAKNTGRMGGKKQKAINIVKTAFEIIHLKTGRNPIELLVRAVENSAPLRRVDLALRFMSEGVREASFSNPKTVDEVLADEIALAADNNTDSYSIKKKNEQERIAMASR